MDIRTNFEDLSNEIFFEIFDYLHALAIFTAFTSLNKRISWILQSIPLHIIIPKNSCRLQIDFLSSHLPFHAHQVISLAIHDTIRDDSSIISLLFSRHNFINLQSCKLLTVDPSTKLANVIKQIKSLNRLISFSIHQTNYTNLNENDTYEFTRTILTHKSSSLRSILLQYRYDYSDISNYTSIASHLTSLNILISGSPSSVSVYSILPILRLCHTVRDLRIIVEHNDLVEDNNINTSIQRQSMNDNDLPILPQLMSFDLTISAECDSRSIACILRCMPNLMHFYFLLTIRRTTWSFPGELLDGDVWKQMLEIHVPYLSKFEFHMSIEKGRPKLDLDIIVNSFEYFVTKYSNWHMIINRWKFNRNIRGEFIMLCTLNYHKHKSNINITMPFIYSGTFDTRSTTTITNDHLFYLKIRKFKIHMTKKTPNVTWSSALFQQINYLIIQMPTIHLSLWDYLLNIVNSRHTTVTDDDAQKNVTNLSKFVHLPNVTQIEFGSTFNLYRWKDIQFILKACPNVIKLIISTSVLISSELFDNPALVSIFKQIKMIRSTMKNDYFPSNLASKFVERFPSLRHVELEVLSFDICVSIIDIFLDHLKHLSYVKMNYDEISLIDDPISLDYIIEKRRRTFPMNIFNEQLIDVENNGETIEIWLS